MSLQPIRIGDTFIRTYKVFAPDGVTPVNLSGYAVSWHLKSEFAAELSFTESSGLTVTDATGTIEIELTPAQTATFTASMAATSWIEYLDGTGEVLSRYQRAERVMPQSQVR